ncbi:MAG: 4-hydroxy-tetrahydrodipicolinate synthase [Flavobacteriales bacterium]|tara:strand:- start:13041 stop:13928 length:888 start_codon:yes stop_codon:yes gene_type:complete
MENKLIGTGVALITPFKSDLTVDYDALTKIVNHCIDGGIDYLVVLGTTGESVVLTKEEKNKIVRHVIKVNEGKLPVVLGMGGNCTATVINEYENFDLNGVDAILSVSPYYNKPSQKGIYSHYEQLSKSFNLPIVLYNVPGRTSSNMSAETTLKLANDFDNIIAVKEASGDMDQIMTIIRNKPDNFLVISGDDGLTLAMILMGANGVISVIGQAFPEIFSSMVREGLNGNVKKSNELHYQLYPIYNPLYRDGNPAGVKECMRQIGLCTNKLRLPLVNVENSTKKELEEFSKSLKTS